MKHIGTVHAKWKCCDYLFSSKLKFISINPIHLIAKTIINTKSCFFFFSFFFFKFVSYFVSQNKEGQTGFKLDVAE